MVFIWNISVSNTLESFLFVDFVGHPYPPIYIPMKVKQSNELSCNVMQQQTSHPRNHVPTNQQNFDNRWTLALMNKKNSTVCAQHIFTSNLWFTIVIFIINMIIHFLLKISLWQLGLSILTRLGTSTHYSLTKAAIEMLGFYLIGSTKIGWNQSQRISQFINRHVHFDGDYY